MGSVPWTLVPPSPFGACRKASTFASSLSLVRFDSNDYSVPVRCAHHPVVVKGCVDRVDICFQGRRSPRATPFGCSVLHRIYP